MEDQNKKINKTCGCFFMSGDAMQLAIPQIFIFQSLGIF